MHMLLPGSHTGCFQWQHRVATPSARILCHSQILAMHLCLAHISSIQRIAFAPPVNVQARRPNKPPTQRYHSRRRLPLSTWSESYPHLSSEAKNRFHGNSHKNYVNDRQWLRGSPVFMCTFLAFGTRLCLKTYMEIVNSEVPVLPNLIS
jgi:hypothetical protein